MKLDEDYKKVMDELQENVGWRNIDVLPESYQDLLNDTIMAVKNLTIQRVMESDCDHEWLNHSFDHFGFLQEQICDKCGAKQSVP